MKRYLLLALLFMATHTFGLPCATNGNVITRGDSLKDVLEKCGTPNSTNNSTRAIPIMQKWKYYKPHTYDQGIAKMNVIFKNKAVVAIEVTDNNSVNTVTSTAICGQIIQVGYNTQEIQNSCGTPASTKDTQVVNTSITEITYTTTPPQRLIFENEQLADWK